MYDTYARPEEHIIADYYVESKYPLMKIGRMIAAEKLKINLFSQN